MLESIVNISPFHIIIIINDASLDAKPVAGDSFHLNKI